MKIRILSGGIQQESHSFNPVLARRSDFHIAEGESAVAQARGTNSTLGGVVDAAEAAGAEVIVPTMFRAQSGGPVEDGVFEEVCERMTEAARAGNFDAIVLPLHGGMLTPTLADPEGELFRALRDIVGPSVPITSAFDLHAHVTHDTLSHCDFLAAYLTNPHDDQGNTGRRAFEAARRMIEGSFDPVCAAVHVPMLTLGNDRTDEDPLQRIHRYAREAVSHGEVEDVSIFNAQQFLDVPGLGQMVLVYGNGEGARASALATELACMLWDARDELIGSYPSVESCLDAARTSRGKTRYVLGDQGDRVAAGGPGDSTFILTKLITSYPDLRALVPIADAEAVRACMAGKGSSLTLTVGGLGCDLSAPVTLTGKVVSAGEDAPLVVAGPHDAGTRANVGPYALFEAGNVTVALTERPNAFLDPEYFRAMGAEPMTMDVIVTRSGYHFTLNFAAVGRCVTVDTPGMTSYHVDQLPFTMARPFYPVDRIGFSPEVRLRRRG